MLELFDRFRGSDPGEECRCRPSFDGERLVVDAGDCPERGRLATAPSCRETVVAALSDRDAEVVLTRADGVERAYVDEGAALLTAAGRFADRVGIHDRRLADRARRDPLAAGRAATGRAPPVSTVAAETGLSLLADEYDEYPTALRPHAGPCIAMSRVATAPPPDARLVDTTETATEATVRRYHLPDRCVPHYHVEPVEATLDADATAVLAAAAERLADGTAGRGDRAPGRALREVLAERDLASVLPIPTLTAVLRKHTSGLGIVTDLLADEAVSDVFATAPVTENRLRVVVDGDSMVTNVRLTERGAEALASRFRRTSGRAFSRAAPTLDAAAETAHGRVRVAGVTDPVSDGKAFAFRDHDGPVLTLPALVGNGTLPARAAGLLSLAVERGAAVLVAGARGAGKTTLLGALLPELPTDTRTVCIEDTPELPVETLQSAGRDVQAMRTTPGEGPGLAPAEALRTALRLGRGALVVGEVRGEEASTLYEAMRVGASDGAVLGTVHGDGAAGVRERVVADLGVSRSAFGATDLVVTVERHAAGGETTRRLRSVEEVIATRNAVSSEDSSGSTSAGTGSHSGGSPAVESHEGSRTVAKALWEPGENRAVPTGRLSEGRSRLLETVATPDESTEDLVAVVDERAERLGRLARTGRTSVADLHRAYTDREDSAC